MKKACLLVFILFLNLTTTLRCFSQDAKKVTISYNLERNSTYASNQLAVWVENDTGGYVSTVYVTKFTITEGYIKRPYSISEWVEKSNRKSMRQEEVDAITGSTQQAGKQFLIWDCKDKFGQPVPPGYYVVRMEANVFQDNRMFYTGKINVGKLNNVAKGQISYTSEDMASGIQIFSDVLVEYKP
jgi:hypothetical protein